jgi:hypothetical protein
MPKTRQRYRIDWYRGYIHPSRKEGHTTVRAYSRIQAIEFGLMRRPGLIVEVTLITKEKA